MSLTDLNGPELTWIEHAIAGSDQPARLAMLHADAERGTRTVLVEFPPSWARDAVGHQPAGEEMVILAGELRLSGVAAGPDDYLVIEPRAIRSATSVDDGTRAVVWFSGPGGGWTDGVADDAGTAYAVALEAGEVRGPHAELVGTVTVHEDLAEQTFGSDVDVLWPADRMWLHAPSGAVVPARPGRAVVHHWG